MGNENRTILTLCVIHEPPRVLLGMKKKGFGAGRWNGFGGKVEPGEAIEAAAHRELREEAGVSVVRLEPMGTIDFEFRGKPGVLEVHVFRGSGVQGEPVESGEMRPQWFSVEEIPFHEMWQDDQHWFPYLLAGKKFLGRFVFDESDQILEQQLSEV